MPLFARPISDITVGACSPYPSSPTTLFDKVDEETKDDDTTYIFDSTDEDVFELKLGTVVDPGVGTGHKIGIYAYTPAGAGAPETLEFMLYEGSTLIATSPDFTTSRTAYTLYEYTLTEAEANAIGAYTDLRIRFHITKTDADEPIRITQAWLEVPEAGADVLVAGTISVVSGLNGITKVDRKASGLISAVSNITGNAVVSVNVFVSGTISAISGLIGLVKVDRKLAGQISGVSSITGKVTGVFTLIGSISGLSNFLGKLVKIGKGVGFHFLSHLLEHLREHEE